MRDQIDRAFFEAVEPLRGGLRLHCYRMLGSSHDGDDIVQEALIRAWRAKDSLKDPELLRPWLYRIATNACLDEIKQRPRRGHPVDEHPAADPAAPIAPAIEEPVWLEPVPDTWIASAADADPGARYTIKESVALAFVAALTILSPVQRATLLLRDVIGLSAEETAEALGIGLSAANSALFRARKVVEEKLGGQDASSFAEAAHTEVDEALLDRYVRAFEDANIEALKDLLHDDVRTSMPPSPTWIEGRAANEVFFRIMFATPRCSRLRTIRTGANGQPAVALYRPEGPGKPPTIHAIQVLTVRDGKVIAIDHFMIKEVFPIFGLPAELGAV